MSSALRTVTMVVLWLAYSLALTLNSRTDVMGGFSGPRIDRRFTDFKSSSMRRNGYRYTADIGGYKYISSGTTWEEARKMCQMDGSDLAIINSQREADVIVQIVSDYYNRDHAFPTNNVWIGNFIPSKGQGEWQTIFGDSLTEAGYNEWQREPDAATYGNCGTVLRHGELGWSDCKDDLGFVCEVPDVPPVAYKVHTSAMNWADAREVCRKEGGDLAILNSNEEVGVIAELLGRGLINHPDQESYNHDNIWIGMLNPAPGQGNWQTIYGDSLAEAGYDKWLETYENDSQGYCGGIFIKGGLTRWECWRELGFVCEGPYTNTYELGSKDEIRIVSYKELPSNTD